MQDAGLPADERQILRIAHMANSKRARSKPRCSVSTTVIGPAQGRQLRACSSQNRDETRLVGRPKRAAVWDYLNA